MAGRHRCSDVAARDFYHLRRTSSTRWLSSQSLTLPPVSTDEFDQTVRIVETSSAPLPTTQLPAGEELRDAIVDPDGPSTSGHSTGDSRPSGGE